MDRANSGPTGRGHNKRRKKGARSFFYRPKYAELRRQQENIQVSQPVCTAPSSSDSIQGSLVDIPLPEHWEIFVGSNSMQCMSQIVAGFTPLIEESFPSNSPQRIFWEQQMACNRLKDKRQIKWHPLVLRFALNLKYLSTSAYRAVQQSGIISLPSMRTLGDYTHWMTPRSGLQIEIVEEACLRSIFLLASTTAPSLWTR